MSKNFNKYPVRMCLVLHINTHYKGQGVLVVYATMSCCVCTKVEANLCVWRLWRMMNSGGLGSASVQATLRPMTCTVMLSRAENII